MKRVSKFILAIFLLTVASVSWGADDLYCEGTIAARDNSASYWYVDKDPWYLNSEQCFPRDGTFGEENKTTSLVYDLYWKCLIELYDSKPWEVQKEVCESWSYISTVSPTAAEVFELRAESSAQSTTASSPKTEILSTMPSSTDSYTETPTAQITPPEYEKASTAEVVFWQSILGSDDPNMYEEYLRQFPQGLYSGLARINLKRLSSPADAIPSAIPDLDYGRYHALVIGNNDYKDLPNLQTAINDAEELAFLLKNEYDFEINLLKNATRSEIVNTLARLRRTVGSQDNLLIYYAGHGILDEVINKGYWLPVDADRESPSNWIQSDTIVAQIRGMQAKHVMIMADSCFSGALTRGFTVSQQTTDDYLEKMVKKTARTVLTSGGLEPVMDSGGSGHSVFARALLTLLEENTGVLDASELFSQLRPKVMSNSDQTPEYGDIHQAGHDGGDFLFVKTANISVQFEISSLEWEPVKWCVTSGYVTRETQTNCLARGGRFFETKEAASVAETRFNISFEVDPGFYSGHVSICAADVGGTIFRHLRSGVISSGMGTQNWLLPVVVLEQGFHYIKLTRGKTCNARLLYEFPNQYIDRKQLFEVGMSG